MTLAVADLKDALKQVFEEGANASDSAAVADALAQAIHDYLVTAQVTGLQVDVVSAQGQPIGTGTQRSAVKVT